MTFKEKMKIQIKNWRWWATLPITLLTIILGLSIAGVACLVYVSALITEVVMVALMLGFHEVAKWRNDGTNLRAKPVKFDGVFVNV